MEPVTYKKFNDKDGSIILRDGRRLMVNPGDASSAALWSPTSILEVTKADDGQIFDLSVKHQITGQQIRARWE